MDQHHIDYGVAPTHRRRTERLLALAALVLIAAAWAAGSSRAQRNLMPAVREALPAAGHFTRADGVYLAWRDSAASELLGYIGLGTGAGYGGPLTVAVAIDTAGEVLGAVVADHKETPAWFARTSRRGLPAALTGKRYDEPFAIGHDLAAVTGATVTTGALGEAVRNGSAAAARAAGLPVSPTPTTTVRLGALEASLVLLFAAALAGNLLAPSRRKLLRWGTLLAGLVVLGFVYSAPLTLSNVTRAILGYWPSWRTDLHFYMLVGGIPLIILIARKTPYCHWFCPFGAAQDCLGLLGGARHREHRRFTQSLKWLPRVLALAAILLGVYFRSPGLASYELFGTLFALLGSSTQFMAFGLVIIASMFIARPWCRYLCPLRPVTDIVAMFREWALETAGRRPRAAAPARRQPAGQTPGTAHPPVSAAAATPTAGTGTTAFGLRVWIIPIFVLLTAALLFSELATNTRTLLQ